MKGTGKFEMVTEIELTVKVPVKFTIDGFTKEEALQNIINGVGKSHYVYFNKAEYEIDYSKIDFTDLKTFNWERKGMKVKSSSLDPSSGWLTTYIDSQGIEHTINNCPGQNITEFILADQFKEQS